MNKRITVNHNERTLTMSKAFHKKAAIFGTNEYHELKAAMTDCVDYTIMFKNAEKKSYHGLTFKVMEEYIRTQSDSEKLLVKFAAVQRIAKAKNSLYPLTKKWFLKTFPSYKINEVAEQETENLTTQLAAEAEKEAAAEVETIIKAIA